MDENAVITRARQPNYEDRALEAYDAWKAAGEPIDVSVLDSGARAYGREDAAAEDVRRGLNEWAEKARGRRAIGVVGDLSAAKNTGMYLRHYLAYADRMAADLARREAMQARSDADREMRIGYAAELTRLRERSGWSNRQVELKLGLREGSFANYQNPMVGNAVETLRDVLEKFQLELGSRVEVTS